MGEDNISVDLPLVKLWKLPGHINKHILQLFHVLVLAKSVRFFLVFMKFIHAPCQKVNSYFRVLRLRRRLNI